MIDKNYFRGKRVTLMGLGLLGRGVGDAIFLAKAGAQLTVTDLKNKKDLATSVKQLKKFKNIRLVLGEHRLEDFRNADLVIKAAGVPLDSEFILEAQKNSVPVMMSTALFALNTKAKIIGVTGTRGKSTVAYLLTAIIKEWLKGKKAKVFLAGNILGVSTLELLNKVGEMDYVVLELDSWQLQGFGGSHNSGYGVSISGFSPKISIFTTFMPDHLNYYQGDMKRYFADKANIYRFQMPGDLLVLSKQVKEYVDKFGPAVKSSAVISSSDDVPKSWKIKIPGEHNLENIGLAVSTARSMKIPDKVIRKAIESFKAIPGRLELVKAHNGIKFYNDTNSTTEEATIVGLKALGDKKDIVLIFGGADKKLESKNLIQILPKYVKALVVLPGTGTDKIEPEIRSLMNEMPTFFVKSMKEAVNRSYKLSQRGDKILMSPAFASFGLFKNEYDRGDKFNEAVKSINSKSKK